MNHTQILKRAWNILWSYKTLWVFGILLAFTSGGGGNFNFSNSSRNLRDQPLNLPPEARQAFGSLGRLFSEEMLGMWIGVGIAVVCLLLLLGLIFTIARYVSRVALIRMVDGYEARGEKVSWREGWRMGWSRQAWQLFLIDLLIGVPLVIVGLILIGCALTPLFMGGGFEGREPGAAAIIAMVGMILFVGFLLFAIGLAVSLVIELIYRACVLEGAGVIDSLRLGLRRLRERFKDVFVMWLILVGLSIAYAIAIIPVALLLLGVGLVGGGAVGLATYFGLNAIASRELAIVTAIILGLGLLFTAMGVPLTFLEGLRQTYFSTTWTLTYRELLQAPALEPTPEAQTPPSPAPAGEALPLPGGEAPAEPTA
jgi:hypothetical protein